jgi:hypothetical protein
MYSIGIMACTDPHYLLRNSTANQKNICSFVTVLEEYNGPQKQVACFMFYMFYTLDMFCILFSTRTCAVSAAAVKVHKYCMSLVYHPP